MTWTEALEDKSLEDLPYRIELNSWGQIVMSPVKLSHSLHQGAIEKLLHEFLTSGITCPGCAVETEDNVKVPDVVWLSNERAKLLEGQDTCSIAPEICIEVLSPGNKMDEVMFKKDLYLKAGAFEFWLCDKNGNMSFFDKSGELPASKLVPQFPRQVEI